MQLIKSKYKLVCDCGDCQKNAVYMIKLKGVGFKSLLHFCEDCLCKLYDTIGEAQIGAYEC